MSKINIFYLTAIYLVSAMDSGSGSWLLDNNKASNVCVLAWGSLKLYCDDVTAFQSEPLKFCSSSSNHTLDRSF